MHTFALPALLRLYRTVKAWDRAGQPHRKKTELASSPVKCSMCSRRWIHGRRVEVAAYSAYCNDTVTRRLPDNG